MKRAVVLVLTNDQGQVLLLERTKKDTHFPSEWCLPGGKVDPLGQFQDYTLSEKDDVACIRECIEETGVIPSLIEDTGMTAVGSDQKFVVKVFKGLRDIEYSEVTRDFPNREHNDFGFFDPKHLPKLVGALTAKIVTQVLK